MNSTLLNANRDPFAVVVKQGSSCVRAVSVPAKKKPIELKVHTVARQAMEREAVWEKKYQFLAAFQKKHGHCKVPSSYLHFSQWAYQQREKKILGKLSREQVQKLEAIGFEWGHTAERNWEQHYQALVAYKEKYGHCLVSKLYEDRELAQWVFYQRNRKKKNALPGKLIRRLNEIGFVWNMDRARWEACYQKLVDFQKEHGHCRVPRFYQDRKFAKWVQSQRERKKRGKLKGWQITKLDAIGFLWNIYRAKQINTVRKTLGRIYE